MNAGRGKAYGKCISDYIVSVDVLSDGMIRSLSKEECRFEYRKSIFHDGKSIIVGACFQFEEMSKSESSEKIQERLSLCKRVQDMSAPNFGTVFCESNKHIMFFVRFFHLGYKEGCTFSSKTNNWMLNNGKGTFQQAVTLIERVKRLHKMVRRNVRTEVRIWYQ